MKELFKRVYLMLLCPATAMYWWNHFAVPQLGIGNKAEIGSAFIVLTLLAMTMADIFKPEWDRRLKWWPIITSSIVVVIIFFTFSFFEI